MIVDTFDLCIHMRRLGKISVPDMSLARPRKLIGNVVVFCSCQICQCLAEEPSKEECTSKSFLNYWSIFRKFQFIAELLN